MADQAVPCQVWTTHCIPGNTQNQGYRPWNTWYDQWCFGNRRKCGMAFGWRSSPISVNGNTTCSSGMVNRTSVQGFMKCYDYNFTYFSLYGTGISMWYDRKWFPTFVHSQLKETVEMFTVLLQHIVLPHPSSHLGKLFFDRVEIEKIRGQEFEDNTGIVSLFLQSLVNKRRSKTAGSIKVPLCDVLTRYPW